MIPFRSESTKVDICFGGHTFLAEPRVERAEPFRPPKIKLRHKDLVGKCLPKRTKVFVLVRRIWTLALYGMKSSGPRWGRQRREILQLGLAYPRPRLKRSWSGCFTKLISFAPNGIGGRPNFRRQCVRQKRRNAQVPMALSLRPASPIKNWPARSRL